MYVQCIPRDVQEVQLDKHIKLLDSPGVIMSKTGDQASLILRNCIRLESLADPLPPIEAILRRCNKLQVSFVMYEVGKILNFCCLLILDHAALCSPRILNSSRVPLPFSSKDWKTKERFYHATVTIVTP